MSSLSLVIQSVQTFLEFDKDYILDESSSKISVAELIRAINRKVVEVNSNSFYHGKMSKFEPITPVSAVFISSTCVKNGYLVICKKNKWYLEFFENGNNNASYPFEVNKDYNSIMVSIDSQIAFYAVYETTK